MQEGDVITRATLEQVDSLFEERRIADDAWERMPNAQADFNDLSKTVNDSLKEQLLKLNRCDSNATMVDVCKYMFGAGGAEELISVRLYDGNLVESIEEITQYIASLYPTRIEIAINLYADCVQIINTGELMKPLTAENLPKKHISILRNPDIANAFFILRYIEMAGSGIQRIINECNRNRCETPVWKSENGQVTLTFPSVYHNQTAVRKRDWKSLTTKLSADETVKKSLAQILDYISLHKRVKLSVLSELTGKSYPTVKRYMQTLKDAGLVTYEGNNRSGGWSLSV